MTKDILLEAYKEFSAKERMFFQQIGQLSALMLTFTAVAGAVVSLDRKIDSADIPFALFMVLIGIFSTLFSQRHTAMYRLNRERAKAVEKRLTALDPNADFEKIYQETDDWYDKEFSQPFQKIPNYQFWAILNAVPCFLGILVLVFGVISMF